jgi:hypothetical protein
MTVRDGGGLLAVRFPLQEKQDAYRPADRRTGCGIL